MRRALQAVGRGLNVCQTALVAPRTLSTVPSLETDALLARIKALEAELAEAKDTDIASDGPKLMRAEGDINLTPERQAWQKTNLDETTRVLLDEDAKYFLHQALSTPCLVDHADFIATKTLTMPWFC